jgi:hypothetical protein
MTLFYGRNRNEKSRITNQTDNRHRRWSRKTTVEQIEHPSREGRTQRQSRIDAEEVRRFAQSASVVSRGHIRVVAFSPFRHHAHQGVASLHQAEGATCAVNIDWPAATLGTQYHAQYQAQYHAIL